MTSLRLSEVLQQGLGDEDALWRTAGTLAHKCLLVAALYPAYAVKDVCVTLLYKASAEKFDAGYVSDLRKAIRDRDDWDCEQLAALLNYAATAAQELTGKPAEDLILEELRRDFTHAFRGCFE